MKKTKNKEEGTFIPDVIKKLKNLSMTEKVILSEYRSYTLYGRAKDSHCYLKNEDICSEWGMTIRNLQTIKQKLKDLGYIRTEGRNVWYLGVLGDTKFLTKNETKNETKDEINFTFRDEINFTFRDEINRTPNKYIN